MYRASIQLPTSGEWIIGVITSYDLAVAMYKRYEEARYNARLEKQNDDGTWTTLSFSFPI